MNAASSLLDIRRQRDEIHAERRALAPAPSASVPPDPHKAPVVAQSFVKAKMPASSASLLPIPLSGDKAPAPVPTYALRLGVADHASKSVATSMAHLTALRAQCT